METSFSFHNQINIPVIPFKKESRHGKHRKGYVRPKPQKYSDRPDYLRLKQRERRAKNKFLRQTGVCIQPPKSSIQNIGGSFDKQRSFNQKKKTLAWLKHFVNRRSFVPAHPTKKHPGRKGIGWYENEWFYKKKLNLNDLPRGCLKIRHDEMKGYTEIFVDIDKSGETRVAKKYRCGYLGSPSKNIKISFRVKKVVNKTGVYVVKNKNGHYEKVADAKNSGEIMLPGSKYYDKKGNCLGYYSYHHWGTFSANGNRVYETELEVNELLKKDFGFEYKTLSQWCAIKRQQKETKQLLTQIEVPIKSNNYGKG